MSSQLPDQVAVILLERVAVPLVNRAGSGIWAALRERVLRRPTPAPSEQSVDFTRRISLRLREAAAISLDLSSLPSAAVFFEVINHSDVDLVLDRVVLELRVGQPLLHDVMAHRYPIPAHETVSNIYYFGLLTEGAAALIRKHQAAARTPGGAVHQIQVNARAYFDSPTLRFAVESKNISQPLPAG